MATENPQHQFNLFGRPDTATSVLPSPAALIEKHGRDLALVINMSGGKDSTRLLGYIREQFPAVKTYVVMADTGFEHVKPISAEDWARRVTASFGLDLITVKNPNKTYLEMVERRGKFPSMGQRTCTSDLKRSPIDVILRGVAERVIINCTGIRAEESPNRGKMNPWTLNEAVSIKERRTKAGRVFQQARTVYNWMPIFEETLADVLNWHHATGTPLHPVYIPEYHVDGTKGGYLRRLSCRVCIFNTDADIRAIYVHDREAFDLVATLEQRINFTMKSKKSLFQIIGQDISLDNNVEFGRPCAA